ncbi:MAG: ribonuclease HII [Pseudomonadota bacterium]
MARASQNTPDFAFEDQSLAAVGGPVGGVDEAGRGPLAGPVVAAVVVLDRDRTPEGLNDSKLLKASAREALYEEITRRHVWSVGIVGPADIDALNILRATMHAMTLAVRQLDQTPAMCLVDGNRVPDLPCRAQAIVKGDSRSLSIAAASIVAKVTRDRIMVALDQTFPGYGWAQNMGYGTKAHMQGLRDLGVTPEHRRSFAPVAKALVQRPSKRSR